MSARGLLDMDMQTLGLRAVEGWNWWTRELRDLLPVASRRKRRDGDLPVLVYQDNRLVPTDLGGGTAGALPRRGTPVTVMVPAGLGLMRVVERPAMSDRDLHRMLAFERATLLPFPAGTTIVAARNLGAAAPGRMSVQVAGLPIRLAREIVEAANILGVRPARVLLREEGSTSSGLDFVPAMAEADILPRSYSATPLVWALVGALAALNVAVMIWRDTASVERLEQLVQGQQPAVLVAQTIKRRVDQDRSLVSRSLARRTQHDAWGGLAATSLALPDGAWLQRYVWDGATVRLAGYKAPKTDIATSLRRSGRFAEVRSMSDEGQATVAVGDPFDLTARIVPK